MKKKFNVDFLGEAIDFMESLDEKTREKIYYNLRKSQVVNNMSEYHKKIKMPTLKPYTFVIRTSQRFAKNYKKVCLAIALNNKT